MSLGSTLLIVSGYGVGFKTYDLTSDNILTSLPVEIKHSDDTGKSDENLSYSILHDSGDGLYASHENDPDGLVSTWKFEKANGTVAMTRNIVTSSTGKIVAHLGNSHDNLWVTNYGAGNLAVFPVKADGDLALTPVFQKQYPTNAGSGVFRERQNQSHPHGSFFYKNGQFVYVTDLGLDKIHRFRREEDGLYTELTSVEMKPGGGPRHLAIDEPRNRAYVLNELRQEVVVFELNPETGDMVEKAVVPFEIPDAPKDEDQYGAGIRIDPVSQKWLVFSVRGRGSLLTYEITDDGAGYLKFSHHFDTAGDWPRFFDFVPDQSGRIVLLEQLKNKLQLLKLDRQNGRVEAVTVGDDAKEVVVDCQVEPATVVMLQV